MDKHTRIVIFGPRPNITRLGGKHGFDVGVKLRDFVHDGVVERRVHVHVFDVVFPPDHRHILDTVDIVIRLCRLASSTSHARLVVPPSGRLKIQYKGVSDMSHSEIPRKHPTYQS